ncbi:uncharacterized protein LOC122371032 [Amphibalanus amphitrite]|uniref:uncharacterized protein LOC122371032 n=1 Tax=Amphibalanus amphitrite TaxID=1232801 RepID=UPI001C912D7B|nr:uncharacterized protein LOC122371032 [Amphibalanus amphitrite]
MQLRIMGIIPSVITFIIVLTVGRHVVSATGCRESNCEFVVRQECQTSETVFCDMKNRPMKQINITAASFPRDAREIKITDVETITIDEDSISSLTSLEEIEITKVNTLILQPRSLARGNNSERITVRIRAVTSLQLRSQTFQDLSGDSRIIIEDVDDCQLFSSSIANAQFFSLTLSGIQSLAVHESAFSDDSLIEKVHMTGIKSLSISKQAFTSNVTVHKTWIEGIENLTIHSGALSQNSRMKEAELKKVKYLSVEPHGIQANIDKLKVKEVEMETCGENTFGGKIGSLSLSSSHIHRATEHCISAGSEMNKLIIENSRFNHTETSAFYGTVREVQIKNSTFGAI